MPGPAPMGQQQADQADLGQPRAVSEEDKALGRSLQKAIEGALRDREDDYKRFAENRRALRGFDTSDTNQKAKLRVNLHFANLAAMRPQVYAKDPEYTVQPSVGVPDDQRAAVRLFGETAEAVLEKQLVSGCRLKRRSKRILTSAYTNAIGWWKLCWQDGEKSPLITNRIRDIQDNIARIEQQQKALTDATAGADHERQMAELKQTLAGLQVQSEVRIGRGLTLDFVNPEDLLVLDRSIFEIQDYERAEKLAHRVWMTRDQYRRAFGYSPDRAKVYRSRADGGQQAAQSAGQGDKGDDLLMVFEVWDQGSNRVHTVCMGDDGLCRESYSPDWTGERWIPFFLLLWNEVDGAFLPPSDVELTDEVVREYNRTRQALEDDRRDARPFTVVRKGGSLTQSDVENIRNRKGNDIIMVEGVGGQSIGNDIQSVALGRVDPMVYDTAQARQDMEMLVGGGDAARGAVLKAKTATEAEILSQGLRGRSAERTDVIEDLLSEVGTYALEVLLRKLTLQEVQKIAGPEAQWPQLSVEDVLRNVSVSVRGGSTGKPDHLQEQDRWTKLLPVIKDTVREIVEVRKAGQEQLAQLAMALLKETLRRFDERFEVEQYLPEPDKNADPNGQGDGMTVTPEMMQQAEQMVQQLQERIGELEREAKDKTADRDADIQKAKIDASARIEVAETTAKIDAAAKVEVARITNAAPPQPMPQEPESAAQMIGAILGEDGEPLGQSEPMEFGEGMPPELIGMGDPMAPPDDGQMPAGVG